MHTRTASILSVILLILSATITPASARDLAPAAAWPGANGKFAFVEQGNGIKTINPDGSDEQTLVAGASSPAWSPDGERIGRR